MPKIVRPDGNWRAPDERRRRPPEAQTGRGYWRCSAPASLSKLSTRQRRAPRPSGIKVTLVAMCP